MSADERVFNALRFAEERSYASHRGERRNVSGGAGWPTKRTRIERVSYSSVRDVFSRARRRASVEENSRAACTRVPLSVKVDSITTTYTVPVPLLPLLLSPYRARDYSQLSASLGCLNLG